MSSRQSRSKAAAADGHASKTKSGSGFRSGSGSGSDPANFATPENSHFYSKNMYSELDPSRLEIRLLRLHPKRLEAADIPNVFPQWVRPGTDASSLLQPYLPPVIPDQDTAILVNLPGWPDREILKSACKQVGGPLPGGWRAVSFNQHLRKCEMSDKYCLSYSKPIVPDILHFVNCYTGQSQWRLPQRAVAEFSLAPPASFLVAELYSPVSLTTMSGKYTALSYCAGNAKEIAPIMVNGTWFNAFANLEHSLESLREHCHEQPTSKTELLIWTDQVCINQYNHREKSHQVAFMRQIYHEAADVYVCLSTASSSKEQLDTAISGFHALRHPFCKKLLDTPRNPTFTSLIPHFGGLVRTDLDLAAFRSWFNFMENVVSAVWWTRAWVYQEFIVASRAFFLFGRHCNSWPEMAPSLELLGFDLSNKPNGQHGRASLFSSRTSRDKPPFTGESASQGTTPASLGSSNSTLTNIFSYLEHVDSTLAATENARERVQYFAESKMKWTGAHDFRTILEKASHFTSTDPRDLIYAFIGLTENSDTITPDYSLENTICHILTTAALKLLESEQNFTILDDALIHGRSGECMRLPSWVPDYTSPRASNQEMIRELLEGTDRKFRASGNSKAQAVVEELPATSTQPGVYLAQALKIRGMYVGDLTSIVLDTYGWSCTFMTSFSRRRATTTSRARVGDSLWLLFGGKTLYVLRPHDGRYSLISAAALYFDDGANWVLSPIMYGDTIEIPQEAQKFIFIC